MNVSLSIGMNIHSHLYSSFLYNITYKCEEQKAIKILKIKKVCVLLNQEIYYIYLSRH